MSVENIENHKNKYPKKNSFVIQDISEENINKLAKVERQSYFEIFLIKNGDKGYHVIDSKYYKIDPKNLFIITPNQVHKMERFKNEDGFILQFSNDFLLNCITPIKIDWLYGINISPAIKLSDSDFKYLYSCFNTLKTIQQSNVKYKIQQIKHYFAYLIFKIFDLCTNSNNNNEQMVNRYETIPCNFISIVENNFKKERKITFYIDQLFISKSHLNKLLKDRFGKTASEIIHDVLLIEIKRLLILNQLSNKEISDNLNFDSHSSYSRFVRKYTGLSPSELKNKLIQ